MARKPSTHPNLPRGMRIRKRAYGVYYYYDCGGKPRREIPLGSDYVIAVQKWAELELENKATLASGLITFKYVSDRYMRDVVPTKAPLTQKGNIIELGFLLRFFTDAPIEQIKPVHIRQYMDWRHSVARDRVIESNKERAVQGKEPVQITGTEGHVRANREIALLSHIFNYSREWGYTDKANPCLGVRKNKESGRDVYVHDDLYAKVYECAEQPLRDYMDFMYLTGQRNADVLKADESQIIDGAYCFQQGKTGKRIRVAVVGEFGKLIERIQARKLSVHAVTTRLIIDQDGTPLGRHTIRSRFDKIRKHLGISSAEFQLRDLRAKAGTDTEQTHGMSAAQSQLGHESEQMTKHYVRNRLGKLVKPTK